MILHKGKEIVSILHKGKIVSAVYRGAKLVWQAIRSCFGAGYWVDDNKWDNEESWKN